MSHLRYFNITRKLPPLCLEDAADGSLMFFRTNNISTNLLYQILKRQQFYGLFIKIYWVALFVREPPRANSNTSQLQLFTIHHLASGPIMQFQRPFGSWMSVSAKNIVLTKYINAIIKDEIFLHFF